MPRLPTCLSCVCLLAALAACAQPSGTRKAGARAADAAQTDAGVPAPVNLVLPRPRGPDDLVEARSGPHVFRFPVKYDYNQAGPFGDGSWMLKFLWPTLEAMPWKWGRAENFDRDWDEQSRAISVSVDYIDRLPIRNVPQNYANPLIPGDPWPDQDIRLRLRQPDRHGLEHWAVDYPRMREARSRRRPPPLREIPLEDYEDWWIARDPDGRMRTFIRCLPMELPGDGIKIVNGLRDRDMSEPLAECRHAFAIEGYSVSVKVRYAREALPIWAAIEARIETFLRMHHIHSNGQEH